MTARLDKWLWAARFFKTRSLARNAIDGGKVNYEGQRSKPSKLVEVGATITIPQGVDKKTVTVKALSDQRRGTPDAAKLYEETPESMAARETHRLQRKHQASHAPVQGRPNKKQRRQIMEAKTQDHFIS